MQISTRQMPKATILDITGNINLEHSSEVRRAVLLEIRLKRSPKIILNLREVNYIDSSGVASLVEGLKASRDVGSKLVLLALSPSVYKVLQLSKLLNFFEICESEDKALEG
jgi:anti-sigma B factor antagonist